MEDTATPTPLIVEPQEVPLDEIASWIKGHRETLEPILAEAALLRKENYNDYRSNHLDAFTIGLRALLSA